MFALAVRSSLSKKSIFASSDKPSQTLSGGRLRLLMELKGSPSCISSCLRALLKVFSMSWVLLNP